jgi:AcrR family transcriptional regulator
MPQLAAPTKRQAPLPADQRRAAIIAAVTPSLVEYGNNVTTRQLAEAAGVSEGTIFNVFDDKDALIQAVIDAALDPEPFEAALAAIDPELKFEPRLEAAAAIVQERTIAIWRLISALGVRGKRPPQPLPASPALTAIFESEPGRVRVPAVEAAHLLRATTLAMTHPMMSPQPAPPASIVDVFLHGLAVPR